MRVHVATAAGAAAKSTGATAVANIRETTGKGGKYTHMYMWGAALTDFEVGLELKGPDGQVLAVVRRVALLERLRLDEVVAAVLVLHEVTRDVDVRLTAAATSHVIIVTSRLMHLTANTSHLS